MQKPLDALMQREMTRKEFVATLGFGVVSLMGLGSIIRFINGTNVTETQKSRGYGRSAYGN